MRFKENAKLTRCEFLSTEKEKKKKKGKQTCSWHWIYVFCWWAKERSHRTGT